MMWLYASTFILIFNCLFIYSFRKWLGPVGIFLYSTLNITTTLIIFAVLLFYQQLNSVYWFVDFGRFFFFYDIIESNLVFMSDTLSLTTASLVLLLTLFAQYFGVEYMYREAFISKLVYLLNFFSTSVVFLFFVYDFFLVLLVWELIGLFSLLLVNFYSVRVYTVKAAFKTFIFSRLSDFFIFIVFFFFILLFNSTDFSVVFLKLPFFLFFNIYFFNVGFNLLNLLGICLVLAGGIKAAQFLFHVWLPDAMEAPTPASALIHSSTLVIMGIYLIIRFNILFEFSYTSNLFMMVLGALTVALGAVAASFQNDIKKLVAYSTVSQMGYLFCGCGLLAYKEVIFYLTIHAINKAFLFIIVGYVVHFFNGNTDLRFMGSLYNHSLSLTFILLFISLNLTGLPLTSGFLAKEFLVFQTLKADWLSLLTRSLWFVSFVLTPFYMLFLNWYVIFKSKQGSISLYVDICSYSSNGRVFTRDSYSPIISKTTTPVLILFFLLNNFMGEYQLFNLFGVLTTTEQVLLNSFSTYGTLVAGQGLVYTSKLSSLLSFVIMLSTACSVKYLRNLSN